MVSISFQFRKEIDYISKISVSIPGLSLKSPQQHKLCFGKHIPPSNLPQIKINVSNPVWTLLFSQWRQNRDILRNQECSFLRYDSIWTRDIFSDNEQNVWENVMYCQLRSNFSEHCIFINEYLGLKSMRPSFFIAFLTG